MPEGRARSSPEGPSQGFARKPTKTRIGGFSPGGARALWKFSDKCARPLFCGRAFGDPLPAQASGSQPAQADKSWPTHARKPGRLRRAGRGGSPQRPRTQERHKSTARYLSTLQPTPTRT
ncbi:hypothetical protein HMPREF0972_00807 [Actinomyces sp. oral taxon 848 str. F0332]|nr:hypothetical protein HMPREF0972_00807 [Actinomyces sp. oral taxon 848 str. F0332]